MVVEEVWSLADAFAIKSWFKATSGIPHSLLSGYSIGAYEDRTPEERENLPQNFPHTWNKLHGYLRGSHFQILPWSRGMSNPTCVIPSIFIDWSCDDKLSLPALCITEGLPWQRRFQRGRRQACKRGNSRGKEGGNRRNFKESASRCW